MRRLAFSLRPRPPFRLDLTVWALRRRSGNAVDRWDGTTDRRVLLRPGGPAEVAVVQAPRGGLLVHLAGPRLDARSRAAARAALDRLLGLRVDLGPFYRFTRADARLAPLAARFRGFRPPRFPSLFEALLNGIACQQLSLVVGLELLNRLAAAHGPAVGAAHALPDPTRVASARVASLRRLGFNRQKSRAMIALARMATRGELEAEAFAGLDDAAAVERLRALPGVGRWTAQYVLLRGLGRLEVFPVDDVGARNGLARWLGRPARLDDRGLDRALGRWGRWGGLLYFHLLLRGLAEAGHVAA